MVAIDKGLGIDFGDLSGWAKLVTGKAYASPTGITVCTNGKGTCVHLYITGLEGRQGLDKAINRVTAEAADRLHQAWADIVEWAEGELPDGHTLTVASDPGGPPLVSVMKA